MLTVKTELSRVLRIYRKADWSDSHQTQSRYWSGEIFINHCTRGETFALSARTKSVVPTMHWSILYLFLAFNASRMCLPFVIIFWPGKQLLNFLVTTARILKLKNRIELMLRKFSVALLQSFLMLKYLICASDFFVFPGIYPFWWKVNLFFSVRLFGWFYERYGFTYS